MIKLGQFMPAYPSIQTLLERPDLTRLLEVKRSLRSIISHFALFFLAILLSYLLIRYFYSSFPLIRLSAFLPLLVVAEMFRKYHDDLYVFSEHRVTHYNGRLSLDYSVPAVKFTDIRSIIVLQDIFGRIFNYGRVELHTAGTGHADLVLEGIFAPVALADLVDLLRKHSYHAGHGEIDGVDSERSEVAA